MTTNAAPRKNNSLHRYMEKWSVGIEIRHGQKSKSHQRLSSEEVKMKQFWCINICIRVLAYAYAHDTNLWYQSSLPYWFRTGTLKGSWVKKSPQPPFFNLSSKNRHHGEHTQGHHCCLQGQDTLKKKGIISSLPLFSWEDRFFSLALDCLQAHHNSCKTAVIIATVPTLGNPLIYWKCHSIIFTSLNTACTKLSESIFHGSVTICHCLWVPWVLYHLKVQKGTSQSETF